MNDSAFEAVEQCSRVLKVDFSSVEFAKLAEENDFSDQEAEAVRLVFEYMKQKRWKLPSTPF